MAVLRNLHRREATAAGTGVASLGLRYGGCLRDTPLHLPPPPAAWLPWQRKRAGDLGSGSRSAGAWKLPWSKDAESRAPSPTGLRVSGSLFRDKERSPAREIRLGTQQHLQRAMAQVLATLEACVAVLSSPHLVGTSHSATSLPQPVWSLTIFNSVCQGTHILFREFSFIQATPHNRASFLRAFWKCFRTVGKNGDLLTMREYHCLLQLLCPDFPLELTQKAARIVLMDDAMDCLMSFSDFLFAFQIQFYYSEFLESVAAIYQDLLAGKNPNTVIVPTSSSGQHRQRPPLGEASLLEGVEASLFSQCLENLCDRHKYSCPPPALVKEVLSNVQRLTFYGFLVALSKHHGINQALGALPDKGDLMHDPAMDEELERLLAQIPGLVNSATANPEAGCLPSRTPPRVGSPWRPLHHARKVEAESDGSTEEMDESET
ncbi:centriolar satellite-associated tubulin polyglutamylase complex regulator 1 isoform X1 [Mustela lutreola]|uniref:centriolar satellite-associated tubulin polyglutamylase complex regulator 1 isoform X1 n=2 Tax=Mustela lutreola TaxID=9666 RepID=UPI0027972528|nr:centriolar satellite-associated tubulin polyglutamylase complex regulator 1 isoform X1 [Mustela lutreola]